MNFKEAYTRLEEIYKLLQSEQIMDIDEIIVLQNEAKKCYDLCQSMLKKAENNWVTSD